MGTKFRINAVIEMKDNSTQNNEDYVKQLVNTAFSTESTEVDEVEILEVTKTDG